MDYNSQDKPVNRLIMAVVQEQDAENAMNELIQPGISVARLPSTGGFLGRRNSTLLIGLNDSLIQTVLQSLRKSCRRRIEYVVSPVEGSPLPFISPTPISVGGATIFSLEVEKYVEF